MQTKRSSSVLVAAVIVCIGVLSTGCDFFKTIADVGSDTSWSGVFDGRSVDGTGDMKVDMGARGGMKCAVVQKKTREGFLTVSISGGESKTTTANFGSVSVCTN